jgi:hypothetical protein
LYSSITLLGYCEKSFSNLWVNVGSCFSSTTSCGRGGICGGLYGAGRFEAQLESTRINSSIPLFRNQFGFFI